MANNENRKAETIERWVREKREKASGDPNTLAAIDYVVEVFATAEEKGSAAAISVMKKKGLRPKSYKVAD